MDTPIFNSSSLKNISAKELAKLLPEECLDELRHYAIKKVGFEMNYQDYLLQMDKNSSITKFIKKHILVDYKPLSKDEDDPHTLWVFKLKYNNTPTLKLAYNLYKLYCQKHDLKPEKYGDFSCEMHYRAIPEHKNIYFRFPTGSFYESIWDNSSGVHTESYM